MHIKFIEKVFLSTSVYFYVQVVCKYKSYITIKIYYNVASTLWWLTMSLLLPSMKTFKKLLYKPFVANGQKNLKEYICMNYVRVLYKVLYAFSYQMWSPVINNLTVWGLKYRMSHLLVLGPYPFKF